MLATAVTAGLLISVTNAQLHRMPTVWAGRHSLWQAIDPLASLALFFLVAMAGFYAIMRALIPRAHGRRAGAALLSLTLLFGAGLVQGPSLNRIFSSLPDHIRPLASVGDGPTFRHAGSETYIPVHGSEVARWIREHSDPNDLLATNMHCLPHGTPAGTDRCHARHHWVSALSERRVLLEGWAYAPAPHAPGFVSAVGHSAFWAPEFLTMNDRSINNPTSEGMHWLTDQGVDWIVVNNDLVLDENALGGFAERRFASGNMSVYRVGTAQTGAASLPNAIGGDGN